MRISSTPQSIEIGLLGTFILNSKGVADHAKNWVVDTAGQGKHVAKNWIVDTAGQGKDVITNAGKSAGDWFLDAGDSVFG
jgi:hypothetical protein